MVSKKKQSKKSQASRDPPEPPETPQAPRTPQNNPKSRELPLRSPTAPSYTTPSPRPNRPVASPIAKSTSLPDEILRSSVRKMLLTESLERIEAPLSIYRQEKRNFSDLSSTGAESSSYHKLLKAEAEFDEGDEGRMKNHLQMIEQKIKAADAAFEAAQALLRELKTSCEDGSIDITKGQLQTETKRLEEEIGDLLVVKAAMRTSKFQLAGKQVDTEIWDKRTHADDWGYLDLLLSRLNEPSGSTVTMKVSRDLNKQDRWRQAVLKAYGVDQEHSGIGWCPIAHLNFSKHDITAAHIVRHNVTEMAAVHLFGPPEKSTSHLWSTRNAIPIYQVYEKMLDDAEIAIVPTNDGELKVIVLDKEMREKEYLNVAYPMGRRLHGRILKFNTDYRPAMRYLYFNFAINILRRQRYAVAGWWKDRVEYADIPFFPTPGKWINETTLRKLAVRVGHMPDCEAEKFVAVTRGGSGDPFQEKSEEDDDAQEKEEVVVSCIQHGYRDVLED